MGFDLSRFNSTIDDEFVCAICHLVLENAMQSPKCDHSFCDQCIMQWLAINQTCPLDRGPLEPNDMKPIADSFGNRLKKLEMKCDFETSGCDAVVKLESLPEHVNQCTYNPKSMVICDKGCGLQLVRKDYEKNNCFGHLANLVIAQQKQIDLLMRNREIWQTCIGIHLRTNEPTVLSHMYGNRVSFAQSKYNLDRDNCYFEIQILRIGESGKISIGVTDSKYPSDKHPGCTRNSVAYHGHNGHIHHRSEIGKQFGPIWKNDDIIGCGVKFGPAKESVHETVKVYFTRNKQFIGERSITDFVNNLFPSVGMESVNAKIKFMNY